MERARECGKKRIGTEEEGDIGQDKLWMWEESRTRTHGDNFAFKWHMAYWEFTSAPHESIPQTATPAETNKIFGFVVTESVRLVFLNGPPSTMNDSLKRTKFPFSERNGNAKVGNLRRTPDALS